MFPRCNPFDKGSNRHRTIDMTVYFMFIPGSIQGEGFCSCRVGRERGGEVRAIPVRDGFQGGREDSLKASPLIGINWHCDRTGGGKEASREQARENGQRCEVEARFKKGEDGDGRGRSSTKRSRSYFGVSRWEAGANKRRDLLLHFHRAMDWIGSVKIGRTADEWWFETQAREKKKPRYPEGRNGPRSEQ